LSRKCPSRIVNSVGKNAHAQPGNFELELETSADSIVDVGERLFESSLGQ